MSELKVGDKVRINSEAYHLFWVEGVITGIEQLYANVDYSPLYGVRTLPLAILKNVKPVVASEPRTERLEDLSENSRTFLLNLTPDTKTGGTGGLPKNPVAIELLNAGLADYWSDEYWHYWNITPRGEALVVDYQRRHMSDGQFDEYITDKNAQDFNQVLTPQWRVNGYDTEDEYLIAQSLARRDSDVIVLQAEVARLQAENEALKALMETAILGLSDIQATARTGLDSGAWGTHEEWLNHMKSECAYVATKTLEALRK